MIVVSHRGPVSFTKVDDPEGGRSGFTTRQGGGGLVRAFQPLLDGTTDGTWIAAALSADDAAATRAGAVAELVGADVRLVTLDEDLHRRHYDVVSNSILWFLFHDLFGLGSDPTFDDEAHEALRAYRAVNDAFASLVCDVAARDEVVLVQDYQLALVGGALRAARPDLRVVHFTHTPFCGPDRWSVLPDAFAADVLASMRATASGFHTARWATAFEQCVGASGGGPTTTFVAPLGVDADALRHDAETEAVASEQAALDELIGDRRAIVRADRIEPSKNIVRGLLAYESLLALRPEHRERVVFVAMLYKSRQSLPLYREYAEEVHATVQRINERWGTRDWTPVVVDERDYFPRTLAGYRRADILFVNPVKDGLNLVAKEAPIVNARDAVLCLSRDAGAFAELGDAALALHPFDVHQQGEVLHAALAMDAGERRIRAASLRERAAAVTPEAWLQTLLAHATR